MSSGRPWSGRGRLVIEETDIAAFGILWVCEIEIRSIFFVVPDAPSCSSFSR